MQANNQNISEMKHLIDKCWDDPSSVSVAGSKDALVSIMDLLDSGAIRVANKENDQWVVHSWIKKAILLSFKLNATQVFEHGGQRFFDKVDLKFAKWTHEQFSDAGFRAVPGSIVRKGAYVAPKVVLMPSFINVGAYVAEGSMIDTWATVGSCAQIGKNCHISGGVGIGGVLEPLQATPVIIEDNCFIGARSEVVEGVIIREGAVLSMGVFIGKSTKIYDRQTGEIFYGEVPPYSVVVPGSLPGEKCSLYAAIIIKKVDANTRSKVSINELLRT
jgi:2,3,4,5-tetrahydropyridine-2-carboxylate N-succinyltransferase